MSADQLAAQATAALTGALSSPTEILALCASAAAVALTVTSSFVKTMVPLRWLAVCGNCGFLAYGVLYPSPLVAVLHAILLPINVIRLREMRRLTRRVTIAAASSDASGIWLKPYMTATDRKAGDVLFRKGDVAEHLYLLVEGRVEFVEIGESVGPGRVFGEIAFFAPDKRRTLTARCSEDCHVLSVNQSTVRQIYYQNPGFGFELIGLVAGRLLADVTRLQEQLAAAKAGEEPGRDDAAPIVET
ncbi:MAG: cyclic nucleotide-binding domain-containing protein [Caldimonas sp.]